MSHHKTPHPFSQNNSTSVAKDRLSGRSKQHPTPSQIKQRRRRDQKAIFFISSRELENDDGPAVSGDDANISLGVELEVGEHMGKVSEGDVGDRSGTSTQKCVFYKISVKASVLMFPRYFRYSIGSTGRIHRDRRR